MGNDHLWSVATNDAGSLAIWPLRATALHFDAAMSDHVPAYADEGMHGSTVLDIGCGHRVRVSGSAEKVGGAWEISYLSVSRDIGGDATRHMHARAGALVREMVNEWAATHEGDIAQADDIDRNNAASYLEGTIREHEDALAILRRELAACEEGEPFTQFPKLPTRR
jgi:hypothetical protein